MSGRWPRGWRWWRRTVRAPAALMLTPWLLPMIGVGA